MRPPSSFQTGDAERFAENVPQRDVDRADCRDGQAAPRNLGHGVTRNRRHLVAHAVVEHLPYAGDIGRVTADELRRHLVVQHVDQRAIGACTAGGILPLSPANDPVIGLDTQDRSVEGRHLAEIAAMLAARLDGDIHPPGLYGLDTHVGWISRSGSAFRATVAADPREKGRRLSATGAESATARPTRNAPSLDQRQDRLGGDPHLIVIELLGEQA